MYRYFVHHYDDHWRQCMCAKYTTTITTTGTVQVYCYYYHNTNTAYYYYCYQAIPPQSSCESRGGRPGLPVPNSHYGLCEREATLNLYYRHYYYNCCSFSIIRSPCVDSGPVGVPAAAAGCAGHVHHLTELDPHPLHDQGREGGTRWFVIVIVFVIIIDSARVTPGRGVSAGSCRVVGSVRGHAGQWSQCRVTPGSGVSAGSRRVVRSVPGHAGSWSQCRVTPGSGVSAVSRRVVESVPGHAG